MRKAKGRRNKAHGIKLSHKNDLSDIFINNKNNNFQGTRETERESGDFRE